VVVGREEEPTMLRLLDAINALYLPNKTLQLISPDEPSEKLPAPLQGKGQIDGNATAYVCHNYTCSAPVTEPGKLEELLK
ncbi:MAG TPA: thioredoxin domain-containing protein, partial [Verrucomicrobiae bacterium]|nr:thioredoxin domain-containing protein [Verrucomicrobiae bacterium]